MHILLFYLLLCSTIIASGCSGSYLFNPKQALKHKLASYENVTIEVKTIVREDIQEELAALREETISKLRLMDAFNVVSHANNGIAVSTEDLHIIMTVIDIYPVSCTKRFLQGAFAGKATITVEIEFIDPITKNLLGTYIAKGSSGGTGYSGGTADAIEQTADAVVEIIKNNI